jgi:ornithine--oxo-acid transaminase
MQKRFLMCRPTYFAVTYKINPWMDPDAPFDTSLAISQWESLVSTYQELGYALEFIDPLPSLPDMVFAANGGTFIDGKMYTSQFRYAERADEAPAYRDWAERHGFEAHEAKQVNEGEGDLLTVGDYLLAGTGFRTAHAAHLEAQEIFGRPVVSLQLVDPRFYHLDTAIAVLSGSRGEKPANIAYLPRRSRPAARQRCAGSSPTPSSRRALTPKCWVSTRSPTVIMWFCPSRRPTSPSSSRRAGYNPVPGRPLRAAPGRRRAQVLHPGVARMKLTPTAVADAERWTAHNYHPRPVVLAEAEGAWVTDIDGKRYLDCLAGYSALNFGHRHPQLIAAAHAQLDRLTLTSRAFIHDQFAEFCHRLAN